MGKTRQRTNTLWHQGFADGRRGKPRQYHRVKILRRIWYWQESLYHSGYRCGLASQKRYWLQRVQLPRWLSQCLLIGITALMGIALAAAARLI